MTTKALLLATVLLAPACAPNDDDSQYDRGSDAPNAGAARAEPTLVVSTSSAKTEGSKHHDQAPDESSPLPTPSNSPGQTPHQSPVQTDTDPELTVVELAAAGSGCPAGSVATNISPDAKAFTLIFDSFILSYAPETGETKAALDCKVEVTLGTPPGWAVTLMTVDWRGFADLTGAARADLETKFSFANGGSGTFADALEGPYSDDYQLRAEATLATAAWSGCDGTKNLTLDLSAKITPDGLNPAGLTVDSVDGELTHIVGLAWRRCD